MRVLCAIAGLLLVAPAARGAVPATLIDKQLVPVRITLQSLRGETINFFGADREYRSEPISRYLQLRVEDDAVASAPTEAIIELTDGQRLRGQWLGAGDDGQSIRWRHPKLGEWLISLETLSAYRPAAYRPGGTRPEADQVTLTNGDVLRGFITAVTDEGVALAVEGRREPTPLALDRVRAIELANPVGRPASAGQFHMVHLTDGSRVLVASLTVQEEQLHLRLAADGPQWTLPLASLARIEFAGTDAELVDLTSLAWNVVAGGEVFGSPMPPRADGAALRLHAPVTVAFDLPAGARVLTARAEIDAGADDAIEWADFHVRISVDGREVGVFHLTAEARSADIRLPLGGSRLLVELDPGVNGPVMDRLRLRDAAVLVRRDAGESP